jgi:phage baseplate assembly protein W
MGLIRGAPYPIVKHSKGYLHSKSDELDQVKSNMLSIILTKPGERVFEPMFGTSLDKINPRTPLPAKIQQTRRMVASSLARWEPRVQVTEVKIEAHDDTIIGFEIFFVNPLNLQKIESMSIQIL